MYMNATVLDARVGGFFDGVEVDLYDLDEHESHKGVIIDGLGGLDELKFQKKQFPQAQPLSEEQRAVLYAAAERVQMPPLMQPVLVSVKKIKANKGFVKLVCRLMPAQ